MEGNEAASPPIGRTYGTRAPKPPWLIIIIIMISHFFVLLPPRQTGQPGSGSQTAGYVEADLDQCTFSFEGIDERLAAIVAAKARPEIKKLPKSEEMLLKEDDLFR